VLKNRLARGLGAGLAVLMTATGLAVVAAAPASAAPIGTMTVTPATGNDTTGNINFDTSGPCPAAATNVIINIAGAGFPANSNAVGNSDIAIYPTNPQGGLTIPLGQTWETLAQSQGATVPLNGTATLTTRCIDIFNSVSFGEFPMQILFTPTTGTHSNYAAVQTGPTATTTVLTAAPANPTPSTTVTLTATVAPSAAAGTVQFSDGGSNLGSPVPVNNGTATFSGTFALGTHNLSAAFTPTNPAQFGPSTGTRTITVSTAPPNSVQQNITTSVPLTGALTITVQNTQVNLPPMQLSGTLLTTSGSINDTTVTDTRNSNPGWNVSGQVTDFAGNPAGTINGDNLGWTPTVVSFSPGQTVTAGAAVSPAPGIAPGAPPPDPSQGLKTTARTMASAAAGSGVGTAVLNATVTLNAPTNTPPGTYTGTLTLTAI